MASPDQAVSTFSHPPARRTVPWISILFFCSGVPALVYQIVWERALFAAYGLNIQAVTLVVSAFMLGLGIGSLVGGALSNNKRLRLILLFSVFEFGTGVFGFFSLKLFHSVSQLTVTRPLFEIGLVCFGLIVAPTLLMGATLPLLAEHMVRFSHNTGMSVGRLYFVNTLGSGFACFVAAFALMRLLGQTGSVRVAAGINVAVALAALFYALRSSRNAETFSQRQEAMLGRSTYRIMPFSLALFCSAFCGFVALSYEIIWYRLMAFATGDTAPTFAALLGTYLFGIAFGSRFAERYSRNHSPETAGHGLAAVILGAAVFAFAVGPACAGVFKLVPWDHTGGDWSLQLFVLCMLSLVLLGAAFFGASFPLIAYVSVHPDRRAGAGVSCLYAANIAGATVGTLVVGLVLMDYFSVFQISSFLLIAGVVLSIAIYASCAGVSTFLKARFFVAMVMVPAIVLCSRSFSATIYDRLLFKNRYPELHFQQVIENRSGIIGVTPDGTVFGGGVYDGRFNTELLHDVNMIVRPFGLSAFHAAPRSVLMIGLGSGSWAQVLANHPQLENLTVVEINPGYLELIPVHSKVASLIENPKVRIVVDDARRWLLRNPERRFDVIAMNNSFYWRNHSSNLLSAEFLRIARPHLNPGGVLFYNTTGSEEVMATGLSVYPYALRFGNAIALSDSPLILDRVRWKTVLLRYVIDGRHVVDAGDPKQMKLLDEIVNIPEVAPADGNHSIEKNDELRQRLKNRLIITDDNMALEWR